MSRVDIHSVIANDVTLLAAVAPSGRGGLVMVALAVAVAAFMMVSGMTEAFGTALAAAVAMFLALLRVAGVGVVALVVVGLLLLL